MKNIIKKVLAFALATVLIISFGAPSYAYTVQKGDTLNKIAKENNVSVDDILKWNKISDKNLIYPGQEIKLQKNMTSSNKALASEEIQILYSMFDAEYYAEKNPDVVNAVGNEEADLFEHFCTYGLYELRQPNKDFNVAAYAAAYNDLSAAFGTDVVLYYRHLYEFGKTEGRTITTMEALAATGVNAKALEEQQYTVKDENGRPQFNVFYEEGVKDFVLPALPAPEPEPEPEPEKVVRIDEIAATLKVAPTKANPWINENGYKGYWDTDKKRFYVANEDFSISHYTDMTDSYVLTGNDYVFEGKLARWSCVMKDGAFSAFKLEAKLDSLKAFEGTYEVPVVKYTVSFDLNGQEGTAPENQKIEESTVATEPSAPTVDGYVFGGWFTDKECTTAWDFAKDTVKANTVLFAKWTEKAPDEATVTFNTNEGTTIDPVKVKVGEMATKPVDPAKTGYTFKGWYKDTECTTEYDFTAPVEEDITIYAKWVSRVFKAAFNSNNGSLNFYYDSVDHSGAGVTVWDNLPLEATSDKAWPYGKGTDFANLIKKVVIDSSLVDFTGLKSTYGMFANLKNAESIEGAEYINMVNVNDLTMMFNNFGNSVKDFDCVPNVCGWDLTKVTSLDYVFCGYGSGSTVLSKVPDVSKWNTKNVTTMRGTFSAYGSGSTVLNKVPDVSEWNISNVLSIEGMFYNFGDSSIDLDKVPDVSGWNTSNVTTMKMLFYGYGWNSVKLNVTPDVSKWNTEKVENMYYIFDQFGYMSPTLSVVPDVSKWVTSNVTNLGGAFQGYGYSSTVLSTVPDVSKWDTSSVTNMEALFCKYAESYGGTSLNQIDVSSWNVSSSCNIKSVFFNTKIAKVKFGTGWKATLLKNSFPDFLYINSEKVNSKEEGIAKLNDEISKISEGSSLEITLSYDPE